MNLPPERIGPYVRALATGLNQLAPHGDFVPLLPALAHLRALDPALSGDQLLPAEVHDTTGMPGFGWMQRVISERVLAAEGADPREEDIERALRLDPELGNRLRHRRSLRVHVRENDLLPVTRLECAVRRMGQVTEVTCAYDRLAPDGRWLRIRFIVRGPGMVGRLGPFQILEGGRLKVDPLLQHLLTRHFATQLMLLREQIGAHTEAEVVRLSRGWVGPFWFPGVQLPPEIPATLGKGLLLQLASEVVAEDVHHAAHLDPLLDPGDERVPEGQQVFRERRFAASANVMGPLSAFCQAADIRCPITPIEGRSRPRTL
ncbi:MAG: hypothetical protein H6736_03305 [Alphaproteobacteria bacterium]|nr:hypothetical protein [Alphaproteobacteria bacterium]MCB9690822.1 hypothetical protein [Alphaproteobacteria bacterium]